MFAEIAKEVIQDVVKDAKESDSGEGNLSSQGEYYRVGNKEDEAPAEAKTKEQIQAEKKQATQKRRADRKAAFKNEIENDKANAKTSTEGMGGGTTQQTAPPMQSGSEGAAVQEQKSPEEQPQQEEQKPEEKPGVEGNTNATAAVGPGPASVSTPDKSVEEAAPAAENNTAPTGGTQGNAEGNAAEGGNASAAQQQENAGEQSEQKPAPQAAMPNVPKKEGQLESKSRTNSVSGTESNTETHSLETDDSTTTKTHELSEQGKQAEADYNEQIAAKQKEAETAKEQYTPKAVDPAIVERLNAAKGNGPVDAEGKPLTGRALRLYKRGVSAAQKEYNDAQQASWDDVYRQLDPNWKSEKEVKRNENLKWLFSAIGDMGSTLLAGGAAFNGVKYPIKSMTAGIAADIKENDAQRKALRATLEKMRQGKIDDPVKAVQKLMEQKEKALRNPAYYNEITAKHGTKDKSGTSGTTSTTTTDKATAAVKDPNPTKGGSGSGGFKTGNNEVTISGPLGDNNLPNYMYSVDAGSLQAIGQATINKLEGVMGIEKRTVIEKKNGKEEPVTKSVVVDKNGNERELNAEEKMIYNTCIELANLLPTIKSDADEKSLKSLQESYNKLMVQIWLGLKNYDRSKYQDFIDYLESRPYVRRLDEGGGSAPASSSSNNGEDEWGVRVNPSDDDDE